MSAGFVFPDMHSGDQFEHQGRVQLRRTLVRALRWCAGDAPVADCVPLSPTDRRALRRLYRLASLRQPRGSMVAAAAFDIWRGLVIESKRCAETIEQGRELRQKQWTGHLLRDWARRSACRARRLCLASAMALRRLQRQTRGVLLDWCWAMRANHSVDQRARQMERALSKARKANHFAGWAQWRTREQFTPGAVLASQDRTLVPPAQNPLPQSTPSTPASASLKVAECGDRPAAAVDFFLTGSKTAMALVCRNSGILRIHHHKTATMAPHAPQKNLCCCNGI
jgi:hypothetical protein